MKFLIVFVVVVCAAVASAQIMPMLSPEEMAKAKQYKMDCMTESGVDGDVLKKARAGEFEEEETLSKFFVCFGKKVGFMNDDGELQVESIRDTVTKFANADIAEKVISECSMQQGTPEEVAFNFAKCSHQFKPTP